MTVPNDDIADPVGYLRILRRVWHDLVAGITTDTEAIEQLESHRSLCPGHLVHVADRLVEFIALENRHLEWVHFRELEIGLIDGTEIADGGPVWMQLRLPDGSPVTRYRSAHRTPQGALTEKPGKRR